MSPRSTAHPTLPSVTEVLAACGLTSNYGFVEAEKLEMYRQRGQALHLAIQWDAEGTLDRDSLHPEIRPGFDAYREFCFEHGHIAECSELELTHPYGFQGHLDRVGLVDGARALIDWKYSDSVDVNGARWQLAGYGLLYAHNYPDRPAEKRLVVGLGKDGRPKITDVTDGYAEQVFTAAVVVYRARMEAKR